LSVYADSSFVISLYLSDIHSPEARRRIQHAPALLITPFHRAEWFHALAQHQFRGELSGDEAQRITAQFSSDENAALFQKAAFPDSAFELCADLARKYGSSLSLRTLDTLHVACALELKARQFWTYDERQKKLARAQGLKTS
jgi:predicted nucleic acid-binding protein